MFVGDKPVIKFDTRTINELYADLLFNLKAII